MSQDILLYGANGFTGQLILQELIRRQLTVTLAGRNESEIKTLGIENDCKYSVFDLSNTSLIRQHIEGHSIVINAAGPFSKTAEPLMKACLLQQVHYLDITGEIEVFELAKTFDEEAKKAGIIIMSGTGFDVVPTDCAGLMVSESLPDASHLEIAFYQKGGQISRGTLKTSIMGLSERSKVRINGKIQPENVGKRTKTIVFNHNLSREVMSIPWGDVSTAYHTTGIPNIVTYMAAHPRTIRMAGFQHWIRPLFKLKFIKKYLINKIDKQPPGPDEHTRETAETYIYARATNKNGDFMCVRLKCQEGYSLTAFFTAYIAEQILSEQLKSGYHTPAGLFGSQLIFALKTTQKIKGLSCI